MIDSNSEEARIGGEATWPRLLVRLRELHLVSSSSPLLSSTSVSPHCRLGGPTGEIAGSIDRFPQLSIYLSILFPLQIGLDFGTRTHTHTHTVMVMVLLVKNLSEIPSRRDSNFVAKLVWISGVGPAWQCLSTLRRRRIS